MTELRILSAGPLTSVQDAGRPGWLAHGVSASGPMDRDAFARAGQWIGGAGATGIEFTLGLAFETDASLAIGLDGGSYRLTINGQQVAWPARALLGAGDRVEIVSGPLGNYGYVRFGAEIEIDAVLGSRSTNTAVGLGGRVLAAGDRVRLGAPLARRSAPHPRPTAFVEGPFRVVWGLHADRFSAQTRDRFVTEAFVVGSRLDRMGVQLIDRQQVFRGASALSLVSDAVVPGDIQILGDGTPIVLMRDHQPTGGYPRIATVIDADLDRFAQARPGTEVRFRPVSVARAQGVLR